MFLEISAPIFIIVTFDKASFLVRKKTLEILVPLNGWLGDNLNLPIVVAGYDEAILYLFELWGFSFANLRRVGTPRVKTTTIRRF